MAVKLGPWQKAPSELPYACWGNMQEQKLMYRLKGQACKITTKIPSKIFLQGSIVNKTRSRLFFTEWQNKKITHYIKYCNYILTYSMVQSPSWAANWFAASQEIPRISWNPKVHYRTHKRTPPLSILGQPNPVHIPTFHLLENHPNIIHSSTPRSPQWSLSLRFPRQDP